MAKTLQFRRDTTSNLSGVTGAEGEIFIDLTKDTVVVMDGSTAGGKPLATESYVTTQINNLIDSAPGTLDTLNELAAALGDDANFATSISNTVATAGGYANSAYSKANSALIHAQAAYNAANTGGGGGTTEITVNSNYSKSINIANTYAYTSTTGTYPTSGNFGYATAAVDSTTGGWYPSNTFDSASYTNSGNYITISNPVGSLISDITTFTGKYIQFMVGANDYMSRVAAVVDLGAGGSYRIDLESNPGGLPNSDTSVGGAGLYIGTASAFTVYATIGTVLPDLLAQLKSGATISWVIGNQTNSITTTGTFSDVGTSGGGIIYKASVDELFVPKVYIDVDITIDGNIPAEASWTFDLDGSFDASSALIGDVLISDDIITPLSYDSYGAVDANTTGTLTINGNLDILGTIVSGSSAPYTLSYGSFTAEVNKKYLVRANQADTSLAITVTLPTSTASYGDVVELFTTPDGNIAGVQFDAGTGGIIGSSGTYRYFTPSGVWFKHEFIFAKQPSGSDAWIPAQSASANEGGNGTNTPI